MASTVGLLGPALDGDLAVARVDGDDDPRPALARGLDQLRLLDRRRAEDDVLDPHVEEPRAVVQRPHAAAGLDRHRAGGDDARQRGAVVDRRGRGAAERGVQIDHVQPGRTGRRELGRDLPGGAAVDRGAVPPPLLEAHGVAAH